MLAETPIANEQRLINAEACAWSLLKAYRHAQDLLSHDEVIQITGLFARAQHHVRAIRHELGLPPDEAWTRGADAVGPA